MMTLTSCLISNPQVGRLSCWKAKHTNSTFTTAATAQTNISTMSRHAFTRTFTTTDHTMATSAGNNINKYHHIVSLHYINL